MIVPSINNHVKLLLATLLGLWACACSHPKGVVVPTPLPATAPSTLPSYVAPRGGFVTKYPPSWQTYPCKDAMLELVPDGATSEARVVTVDVPWVPPHLPGMISIARIDKGFIDDLKKRMKDVVVVDDAPQVMAGAKARRIRAKGTEDGVAMTIDAVVAMHNETVYILSAETDAAGAADAHSTLESVLANWQWK